MAAERAKRAEERSKSGCCGVVVAAAQRSQTLQFDHRRANTLNITKKLNVVQLMHERADRSSDTLNPSQ